MPKLNKPRTERTLDPDTARAFLNEHQIEPSEVTEVSHFADGSMSILMQKEGAVWHEGIEFDPDFTSRLSLAFTAIGVPVHRRNS